MIELGELIARLVARLPRWVPSTAWAVLKSSARWYWRLSVPGMLLATVLLITIAWTTLDQLGISPSAKADARELLGGILTVVIPFMILIGLWRGTRGSRGRAR